METESLRNNKVQCSEIWAAASDLNAAKGKEYSCSKLVNYIVMSLDASYTVPNVWPASDQPEHSVEFGKQKSNRLVSHKSELQGLQIIFI